MGGVVYRGPFEETGVSGGIGKVEPYVILRHERRVRVLVEVGIDDGPAAAALSAGGSGHGRGAFTGKVGLFLGEGEPAVETLLVHTGAEEGDIVHQDVGSSGEGAVGFVEVVVVLGECELFKRCGEGVLAGGLSHAGSHRGANRDDDDWS